MKRVHGLLAGLALTLLAAWWAAGLEDEPATEAPRRAVQRKAASVRSAPRVDLAALSASRPALADGDAGAPVPDLFPVRSFAPPPPPPPPPPTPTAPPLPFRYTGMLEEGGRHAAFLEQGEQIRVVRVGDTLDGRYRVTAVSRARIDLIYLPLNEPQSLVTGATP